MKIKNIILTLLLLTSCKPNYPFTLNEKYYEKSEIIELTNIEEFNELERKKDSFGIYIYLPGCLTCSKFKPILDEFIKTNNITLYSISYLKIKNTSNTLVDNIETAPSLALFSDGKLVSYLDANKDEHIEYYESLDGFTNWFKTYVEI